MPFVFYSFLAHLLLQEKEEESKTQLFLFNKLGTFVFFFALTTIAYTQPQEIPFNEKHNRHHLICPSTNRDN